ncbi:MAG: ABC transporter substrate-binding protein [Thermomicrobiales bacterium]|nr:ABC transporter substrate-binding protein [Thermomicrobiales bacterium]MCO5218801.1 ABC transporter substrate-binding protein [Thermomicrobiales bacterium]MCO5225492.1 ABC transporter substrate-binding protein [Thermomicrobiales bacterium]MCO5229080.1 ABC transporter substrate-binding protein [Thermomicrobiales bacterium]
MSYTQIPITRRSILKGTVGTAAAWSIMPTLQAAYAAQDSPVEGGRFTFGNGKPAEPIINPNSTIGTGQNVLIEPLFLRLVYPKLWTEGMNPPDEFELEYAVAESMIEIETDRVWEIKLRENVFWHDGEQVTADDLIFGVWWSLNSKMGSFSETPALNILGGQKLIDEGAEVGDIAVEGLTKIDDFNVRLELTVPTANYWKSWYVGYWPMPVHIFGGMPFDQLYTGEHATVPVGNGPFKAVAFVEDQYMEFEAFDDFYLGRPLLDSMVVRFGDGPTLTAALEAQEIDGMNVGGGATFDRLTTLDYLVGNIVTTPHPNGFVTNFERLPDHAAAINKAIQHAIDVDTINTQLFSNTLTPGQNFLGHMPGMEENPEGWVEREYNPDKAREVLQEAGWDANRTLEWLIIGTTSPLTDAIMAMLAAVGLKAEYRVVDTNAATDELYRETNFDIVMTNFGPYDFMEPNWKYFKTDWTFNNGGFNTAHYANADVDALIQSGLDAGSAEEANEFYKQALLLMNDNPPHATLYRGAWAYVWNTRVQGAWPYQYRQPVRPPFERVWIQES